MRAFRPATPYGEAAQGLGDAFVKGLVLAPQRERAEAAAGFDRLRTEQLQSQMQANQGLGALFQQIGQMPVAEAAARMGQLASAYGPDGLRHLGQMVLGATSAMPGLTPEQMTMPQLAAGMNFGNTVQGTREGEAAQTGRAFGVARINNDGAMARQNAMPMPAFDATTNQPRFTTQGQAATSGFQPVLALNEAKGVAFQGLPQPMRDAAVGPSSDQVLGTTQMRSMQPGFEATPAEQAILNPPSRQEPTPRSFRTASGQTGSFVMRNGQAVNVRTGLPIEEDFTIVNTQVDDPSKLTPPELRNTRGMAVAGRQFTASLNDLDQISLRSPEAFGATGNILRILQTGVGIAENLGLTTAARLAESEIAQKNPQVQAAFAKIANPDLGDVGRLAQIAVFQAASFLTGQQGREISNADVERLSVVLGDPRSWINNPVAMRQGIARLREYAQRQSDIYTETMGLPRVDLTGGSASRSSDPQKGPPAPPPDQRGQSTAPPAQSLPPGVTIRRLD